MVIALFSSCTTTPADNESASGDTDSKSGISIVTTIFPIYDWVKNITGSAENVIYFDENGIDLHSFEPTADNIITLSSADLFICIGGTSDEWVDNAVKSAENENLQVLRLMEITGVLEEETVEGMEADHEEADIAEYDEHVWLSLKKAQTAVRSIADALCGIDPENADFYRTNAENYINDLKALDGKYEVAIASAKGNTLLFADRFPFRYLTEDYALEYYAAFPGCSAESEASFETIAFLIEKTKELKLDDIIVLEGSDRKIASTVASETGAEIVMLDSCQSVTKKDVADGKTYISVMEENLKVITEALS